jgi:hypothetical protein
MSVAHITQQTAVSAPHINDITWTWSTPRPSPLDPLIAPDLATGLAHAREQAAGYRELALAALAQIAGMTATMRRLEIGLTEAHDEIRRLRRPEAV